LIECLVDATGHEIAVDRQSAGDVEGPRSGIEAAVGHKRAGICSNTDKPCTCARKDVNTGTNETRVGPIKEAIDRVRHAEIDCARRGRKQVESAKRRCVVRSNELNRDAAGLEGRVCGVQPQSRLRLRGRASRQLLVQEVVAIRANNADRARFRRFNKIR